MDFEQARAAAERELEAQQDSERPLALSGDTIERSWCWAFFFNSREFLETGNPLKSLVGVGPLVVNKDGSEIWITGSGEPAETYLDEYAHEHGYPTV